MEWTAFIGLSVTVVMVVVVFPNGYLAIETMECPVKIGLLYQADDDYSWIGNLRLASPFLFLEEIWSFCNGTYPQDVIDIKIPNRPSDSLYTPSVVDKLISRDILIGPFYPDIAAFLMKHKIVYFLTRILDIAYANNNQKAFNDYVIEMWPSQRSVIDGVAGYMMFYGIKKVALVMLDAETNTIDISQALYHHLINRSMETVEVYYQLGLESGGLVNDLLYKGIKTVVLFSEEFSTNMTSSLTKIKKLFFNPDHTNLDRDEYEFVIFETVLRNKMKAPWPYANVGNVDSKLITIYYTGPQMGIDETALKDIKKLLKEMFSIFGALPTALQTRAMFASIRQKILNLDFSICYGLGDVAAYDSHGQRSGCFIMFDAWSLGRSVKFNGNWVDGIFSSGIVSFPRPPNVVYAILSRPFFSVKQGAGDLLYKNDRYEGIAVDIMNEVMKSVRKMEHFGDFEFEYVVREDGVYGSQDANGSWSGVFGQLDDDTAGDAWDKPKTLMAVGSILKTSDRLQAFTFLPGVAVTPLSFVTGTKGQENLVNFQFMNPYTTTVWVGVVVAVILAAAFVYVLDRWNPMGNDLEPAARYKLNESLWYSYQTITQAGGEIVCSIFPMQLFSVFYWFFSLVVIACYTSNLANFLTEPAFDRSGLSFGDLALEGDMRIGFLGSNAAWKYFRDSTVADHVQLFSRAVVFRNMTDAVERVKTENIALVEERIGILMEAATDPSCDLAVSDAVLGSFEVSFPLSKSIAESIEHGDVQLREEIANSILRLRHSGKLHDISKRWLKTASCVIDSETLNRQMQFGIWNFIGLFAITGGATVLAFVALMATMWYNNLPGRTKKQDRVQEIEEAKDAVSGCTEVHSVSTRL